MKKPKNKKTKTHIKFDREDRKVYLTGFRKRKLERKAKAKEEMILKLKTEKKEIKRKRLDLIQDMLEDQVDESDDDNDNSPVVEAPVTVSQCGNSVISVTDLKLEDKNYLGANKKILSIKTNPSLSKKPSMLQMVSSSLTKKNIKNTIWKAATKNATKSVKEEGMAKKLRKKKKVMVTEL